MPAKRIDIRSATPEDSAFISGLIQSLAHVFTVEPDGSGAEGFLKSIAPPAITGLIASANFRYYVGHHGNRLAGVVAIRDNAHLHHLFVDRHLHGKGIGTQLWEHAKRAAIRAGNRGHFTVNSTVFAVKAYEAFGFRVTGPKTERNGIAFVPMALEI
ncbi:MULTISPECIES: GNAT family N-acetyltransferase [Ralstonia solanacearum species complex]|uniref:GNAT family N-acetyltransferase n=1 Tax=Ralstonia solanacearum species complex TaxID=3116862 RepID=UPI001F08B1E9|nr:GNAT family N-acetyltransferase [Ralstonia solanacearum]BEU73685.1 hypothetical protein MAFF211271_32400 [Ralstonia pseudosolanacearum]